MAGEERSTYLIAGLGNPGREHRDTRHNVGFMAIDRIGKAAGISVTKVQAKALVGIGQIEGCRVVLAKPQTFMNLSGQAVSALLRFYKVPLANLMVAHDDIDLAFGMLRIRLGGSSAGQKGVASIIQQVGSPEFIRLRIGVGRPPGQMDPSDYVVERFLKDEQIPLDRMLDRVAAAVQAILAEGISQAMNRYNGPATE